MSWHLGASGMATVFRGSFRHRPNLEDIPNAIDLLVSIDQFNFDIE
ncbi:hypothetical protein Q3C01_30075 [Bradyrhizobium sp. UFLA05-109]